MSIEITPKLLADLRQNAEAATPGDPAVVLALVAEVAKLKVDLLETQIQRAEGVLRMFRGEQQDFAGLFSEGDLNAEGLDKPAEIDGTTAGIWASFIERKQLECEQYRSLVNEH